MLLKINTHKFNNAWLFVCGYARFDIPIFQILQYDDDEVESFLCIVSCEREVKGVCLDAHWIL